MYTVFALHYAHSYDRGNKATPMVDDSQSLDFPGEKQPVYWDFLCFSFVISMTAQVSDVQVTSHSEALSLSAQVDRLNYQWAET